MSSIMKEDWEELLYSDAVYKISTSKQKLNQKQYLKSGSFPIVDQGQDLIGGYTNDENRVIECDLPVIVFGDHTKILKLIDFKFVPGADGTKILEPSKYVLPHYLKILTEILTFKIKDNGYARHYQHIEKEFLPLAPLPIQRAIISKTEELFSDLDNGITNFKKAQAQLKIYRQAVLKKAFEGELTKDWRAKQTNLPTAAQLLKQIKEERQNYYDQQILDWKKAVKEWEKNGEKGKKPSKPQAKKELPPFKEDELKELAILPNGWAWCRISDIGNVETGATPKRGNSDYWDNGNIPWITSGALNDDFVRECKEYVTPQALKETNIKIFPKHSLVMAMYGEGKTRGKSSELLIETATNQAIACIVQKDLESKTRKYLKSFLVKIYQDIRRKSSGGVQPNINLDIVKNLNLPMCSILEQAQIVQEIESRLSVCDKVEQSINESIIKAEALRQSILKKAFEGRILSKAEIEQCKKEVDYEPASELLKKIKAEKVKTQLIASQQKKKPTVKKKSKK